MAVSACFAVSTYSRRRGEVTLGPRAATSSSTSRFGAPRITKDGVTVAKEIELEDKFENMGAQMVRKSHPRLTMWPATAPPPRPFWRSRSCTKALKFVAAGMNPTDLKRGIDNGRQRHRRGAEEALEDRSNPPRKSRKSAPSPPTAMTRSARCIAEAMDKVGKEGVITVEEGKGLETELEVVEGMQFDRGYLSPYFITNADKMRVELENPYILLHEKKLSNLQTCCRCSKQVVQLAVRLLIIAEDVEGEALATLVVNKLRGGLKVRGREGPGLRRSPQGHAEDIATFAGRR